MKRKQVYVPRATHQALLEYVEKKKPERVSIASVIEAAVGEYLAKRQ